MSELKPCPFCGGEAEAHAAYDMDTNEVDGYFVICRNKNCTAWPETAEYPTEAEAIAAWNTRYHSAFEETVIKAWEEIKAYRERTCKLDRNDVCNVCGASIERVTHSVYEMGDGFACHPNYCPNCGAKVVE